MNFLKKILPHINFVFFVILVTLLIVDHYNPAMEFLSNNMTRGFLWVFGALAVLNGVVMLIKNNKGNDKSV